MENFNKNNPTQAWTEDEKYDFCKIENKWIKELPTKKTNRKVGFAGAANDPVFSSVEEINSAFKNDIFRQKEMWKHLCQICDYATNMKVHLTRHLAVHGIGKRFKCDKCDKEFAYKQSLKNHRETHNSTSDFQCQQCGKIYKTCDGFQEHMKTHWEKIITCDQCEKMFSTTAFLKEHKKAVHVLKSFKCGQCHYRAKLQKHLKTHIKRVHDGVPDKSSKCDLCDYQGTSSNLKKHKESIHENKKNWFCKACPYSSYHKKNFIVHMRVHTGEKPYQCKTCHECFSHLGSAKLHCKNKEAF